MSGVIIITPADLSNPPNAAVHAALRSRQVWFQGFPEGADPQKAWEEFVRQPYDLPPSPDPALQFFRWEHLPPHLGDVSRQFADLAQWMDKYLPPNRQRDLAFQRLMDAKDAAVRAKLWKEVGQ